MIDFANQYTIRNESMLGKQKIFNTCLDDIEYLFVPDEKNRLKFLLSSEEELEITYDESNEHKNQLEEFYLKQKP